MSIADYQRQIEAALVYNGDTHSFEDVVQLVEQDKAQAWFGPASVIITQLVDEPRKKIINFFLAGGNLAELEAMVPKVLEWAKHEGCTSASFIGRRGWERTFLTRTGWTPELVVFEKPLNV